LMNNIFKIQIVLFIKTISSFIKNHKYFTDHKFYKINSFIKNTNSINILPHQTFIKLIVLSKIINSKNILLIISFTNFIINHNFYNFS
jgi:hypothetical protein